MTIYFLRHQRYKDVMDATLHVNIFVLVWVASPRQRCVWVEGEQLRFRRIVLCFIIESHEIPLNGITVSSRSHGLETSLGIFFRLIRISYCQHKLSANPLQRISWFNPDNDVFKNFICMCSTPYHRTQSPVVNNRKWDVFHINCTTNTDGEM